MKRLLLALLVLFICSFYGCGNVQDSKGALSDPRSNLSGTKSERSAEAVTPEFYPPETGPDLSDGAAIYHWADVTGKYLGPITLALNWYESVNGEWPVGWDELVNGYLLFLPVHPITGEQVSLLTVDELNGPVEATAVVADPHPNGWDIYQAHISADGIYYASKVYDREQCASAAEITKGSMI